MNDADFDLLDRMANMEARLRALQAELERVVIEIRARGGAAWDAVHEALAAAQAGRILTDTSGNCACVSADARWCYEIRYDVAFASDGPDDGRCECGCHSSTSDDVAAGNVTV